MKRNKALLTLILIAILTSIFQITSTAATQDIIINGVDIGYNEKDKFTDGCNKYGWQCYGFAEYCSHKVHGVHYNSNPEYFNKTVLNRKISGAELKTMLKGIAPAAHVRSRSTVKGYAHSWCIISTTETHVTFCEANYDWNNSIRTVTTTYNQLAQIINSYGGLYRITWLKNYTNKQVAEPSNDVVAVLRANLPIKASLYENKKVPAYSDINLTNRVGRIYETDIFTVTAIYYQNKIFIAKVNCPWDNGTTKTVYIPLSAIVKTSATPSQAQANGKVTTYLHSDLKSKSGYVGSGDIVVLIGDQVLYPLASGGCKLAFYK